MSGMPLLYLNLGSKSHAKPRSREVKLRRCKPESGTVSRSNERSTCGLGSANRRSVCLDVIGDQRSVGETLLLATPPKAAQSRRVGTLPRRCREVGGVLRFGRVSQVDWFCDPLSSVLGFSYSFHPILLSVFSECSVAAPHLSTSFAR